MLTQPEPAFSAIPIAISFDCGPTTRPRPLSPSMAAVLGVERRILILGVGLMRPSLASSKYLVKRATPWESTPRRSPDASTSPPPAPPPSRTPQRRTTHDLIPRNT